LSSIGVAMIEGHRNVDDTLYLKFSIADYRLLSWLSDSNNDGASHMR
jgi:hypothetical protein